MTKFLSKVFLSGILLSSVSGYCSTVSLPTTNINVGIGTDTNSQTTEILLNNDYTQSGNLNVGTKNWETSDDLQNTGYTLSTDKKQIKDSDGNTVAEKNDDGVWEPVDDYKFHNVSLDLNNHTLTLSSNNTLTLESATVTQGTISLSGNNTVIFKHGSEAGANSQQVTINGGNNNANTIDFTNYLSTNTDEESGNTTIVLDTTNGSNLYLILKGAQSIKLFDETMNNDTIIKSFPESTDVLFPNITAESITDNGATYSPTFNVPLLYNVTSDDTESSIASFPADDKVLSDYKGNTIGISTIKYNSIFSTNSNITFQIGDYNSLKSMLQELVTSINGTNNGLEETDKIKVNVDSFIKYDSNIDVLDLTRDKSYANILVNTYELKLTDTEDKTFDFKNITVGKITEPSTENTAKKTIQNVVNSSENLTEYVPNSNSSGDIVFDNSSVVINGGAEEDPTTINNITLQNSILKLNGNINLKAFSCSDDEGKNSSIFNVTTNSKITLG